MHNFWMDQTRVSNRIAVLGPAETHHLISVLRLKTGEEIGLLDGKGTVYKAKIVHIKKEGVEVEIVSSHCEQPPKTVVYLGQGLLKWKKMDFLYQKATELGVAGILPFFSARCVKKEKSVHQQDRWRQITVEACKQCGQPFLPQCYPTTDYDAVLEIGQAFEPRFILWEGDCPLLKKVLTRYSPPGSVLFLVGPEGGFSLEEVDKARAAGFLPISLGKLVKRSETAALAMLSILQFHFEG